MKKNIITIVAISLGLIFFLSGSAYAYWLWTPETKKFINPKYAVKDSPKEQFDWAMSFYNAKDYQRSAAEFEKLVKQYEYSEYASDAQYYTGLSYENMGKFYTAFQNYQKTVENFPHIENLDEIIAREYNIANLYATKDSPKVLGMDIMTALDRAIEIYKKVVDNAPYGKLADEAQFKMGEALKKSERYDEAIQAFQKVVDDYPSSKFFDKAKYEAAYCSYKASLKPAYDVEPTAKAIKAFQDFAETNQDSELSKEADKTVLRLKDKAAEKSLMTARFYESQKHYRSAIIYYKDVIERFPDCSFVKESKDKIDRLTAIVNGTPAQDGAAKWKALNLKAKPKPKEAAASQAPKQHKQWKPVSLGSRPKPKEASAAEAPAVTPAKEKKTWKPFGFISQPKKKEVSGEPEAPKVVKQHKVWKPVNLAGKPKPKKEEPKIEEPKKDKKSWKPFGFTSQPKNKETSSDVEKPKAVKQHKAWKPVNLESKPKPKEAVPVTEAPKVEEPKKEKKEWKPLSFGGSEKAETPKIEEPKKEKKSWKPFGFTSQPKKKEVSGEPEAPKVVKQHKVWKPVSFGGKVKPKEAPAAQTPVVEKPVEAASTNTTATASTVTDTTATIEAPKVEDPKKDVTSDQPEAPKAIKLKSWSPINFTNPKT